MKKTFVFVLLAAALAVLLGIAVSAMDNGIMYEIVDDAVTITGYNGISTTIVIPDEIDGKPVKKIAPYAFERSDVKSVILPNGLEEIGQKAFFRCYDLSRMNVPASLKSIAQNAFSYTGLIEVDLSVCPNIETIGAYAFAFCDSLKTFTFPEVEGNIGSSALEHCRSLEKVNRNVSVGYSGGGTVSFKGDYSLVNPDLKYLSLKQTVNLGYDASERQDWGQYRNVEEIHIEDPVNTIIDGTNLAHFDSLKTISLGERITQPENSLTTTNEFYDIDQKLGIIYSKSKLDKAGKYVIQYVIPEWEGAEILVIPDNTYKIAPGAFNQCKRKAVVFSEANQGTVAFATTFKESLIKNTVFFFPDRVENVKGIKTVSLKEFDPYSYPYNELALEDIPNVNSFEPIERIADNSDYPRTAQALNLPFTDADASAWYFEAVNYAYHAGFTSGTGGSVFSPGVSVTRAMFVQMLAKIENAALEEYGGRNSFTDVPSGAWYHDAVEWAAEKGMVAGTGEGIFEPEAKITREQIAVMMKAVCGGDESADISVYADADSVSSWAVGPVRWAVGAGYLSGMTQSELAPRSEATRAQSVQILYRYIDKTKIDYVEGDVKVSKAISDDMIIQRGEKIKIWGELVDSENEGRADVGKYVKVSLGGKAAAYAVVDKTGAWTAELDRTLPASGEKLKLTVSTKNKTLEFNGVMIGDVYMIIGQSNVFYSFYNYQSVSGVYFTEVFAQYLREMKYLDNVRLFRSTSEDYKYYRMNDIYVYSDVIHDRGWQKPDDPAMDYEGKDRNGHDSPYYVYRYTRAEPTAAEVFSALGYCFACEMYERTGVPTGVIDIDAAGYSIGSFLPAEICEAHGTDRRDDTSYVDIATGMKSRFVYNQCINPIMNYSIAGLIWYQGESDAFNCRWNTAGDSYSFAYRWRDLMTYLQKNMGGGSGFPVLLTEFPMCTCANALMYIDVAPVRTDESFAVSMTDNAYLISTADVWTDKAYWEQIHAPAKAGIAKRAADIFAAVVYGESDDISTVCGPSIKNVEFGNGEITLTFDNVGDGLEFFGGTYSGGFYLCSGDPLTGRSRYEIADPGKVAIIGKDKIRITCDHTAYSGITYWSKAETCFPYDCNLCNSSGVPAGSFAVYK
ncbi:MAG: S-layer homology domain-containing protein [Clostridia bacterium]|nr:S-layer homology domain-containing protein [Clostridia bacterium]